MNRIVQLTLACFLLSGSLFAQKGLGINTPDPQAALHIVSPDKGVLLPQISLTASTTFLGGATATASHTGMLVYNTNTDTSSSTGLLGEGYYFWNSSHWEKVIGDTDLFTDLDGDTQIQVEEGADDDTIRFDAAGVEIATLTSTDTIIANALTASSTLTVNSTTTLKAALVDGAGNVGTSGQVLSSTGASTNWISLLNEAPVLTATGNLPDDSSLGLDTALKVAVQGDYAYVVSRDDDALQIVDISNPQVLTGVGSLTHNGTTAFLDGPHSVYAQGNFAYVVSSPGNSFQIIDISNPSNPTPRGFLQNGTLGALLNEPQGLYIQGNYAYVTGRIGNSLQIIDISNPDAPIPVGSLTDGTGGAQLNQPIGIQVQGNYAYIASFVSDTFQVFDVSDPTNPTALGFLSDASDPTGLTLNGAFAIFIQGNYAYVTGYFDNGLQVINISNPNQPVAVGNIVDAGTAALTSPFDLFVQGNYAYVASLGESALQVIDISSPATPTFGDTFRDNGDTLLNQATSVYVRGNNAYMTSLGEHGLQVISLGNNEFYSLKVGSLETSSIQVDNHAQFSSYLNVRGGLSVGASANINEGLSVGGSLNVRKEFIDSSDDAGTAGQVLSSTATGTNWVNASVTNIRVVTGNYTLTSTDTTLIVKAAASTALTITLPAVASVSTGIVYHIKRFDAGGIPASFTIDGAGIETIDGSPTATIADKAQISLQSDGTEWYIISN